MLSFPIVLCAHPRATKQIARITGGLSNWLRVSPNERPGRPVDLAACTPVWDSLRARSAHKLAVMVVSSRQQLATAPSPCSA